MSEFLVNLIEKLTVSGFLETRAFLYMDIMVTFLASLPFLLGISIMFAMKDHFKLHKFTQTLLFSLTVLILGLFAYIVHYQQGFDFLLKSSSIDTQQASLFLMLHVIIAISTTILWFFALIYGISDRKRRALPGVYSASHRKSGRRVFLGVLLTSLTSVGVYWMLFVA